MEQWIIGLLPVALSTAIILLQIARAGGRDDQRMANIEKQINGIEKRLDDLHVDLLRKDVFTSELKNVTSRIDRAEDRVVELERKVFNGARH